jgi:predicted permease
MTIIERLRMFLFRLRTVGRRDALARGLDEELRLHAELLARDYERAGLSGADAMVAARRKLGSPLGIRERSGDQWGVPVLEQLLQDIRYGLRLLRRSPAFACVAIGAVGIAVGINTGFFTLVDAMVWQPIPVARPERLVKLLAVTGRHTTDLRFSYDDVQKLAAARTVTDVVAYWAQPTAVKYARDADAVSASVGIVSGNYFDALGGRPAIGRLLSVANDAQGGQPAVVLSDGAWTKWFARSREIVGRRIVMNGGTATVVGVATAKFIGINPLVPDVWMTATDADALAIVPGRLADPSNRLLSLRARLAPGITRQTAEGELSSLIADSPPFTTTDSLSRIVGVALMPSGSMLPNDAQTAAMIAPALLVVALVLVIACANLANLLLARALVRQREIALRTSLGASRARLVRQLLTESAVIALAGCTLGYVLSRWVVDLTSRAFFAAVPTTLGSIALTVRPSWHVLAYAVALAALSVVSFGLVPALQATTPDLASALKGEDRATKFGLRRSRLRDALISVQVAGSLVLLCAAGIIAKGVRSFATDRTGLAPNNVLVAEFGIASSEHMSALLSARRAQLSTRVATFRTVAASASAMNPPFTSWSYLHVRAADRAEPSHALQTNRIGTRYFDVVGQRVLEGRSFDAADSANAASVVIVSRNAAHALWPDAPAIGRRVRIATSPTIADRFAVVVGVVADSHNGMVWDADGDGAIFEPLTASDFAANDVPLLVRPTSTVTAMQAELEAAARMIDQNVPLTTTRLTDLRALQIMPFRYGAAVTSAVGLAGLGLALIGLYGVISFSIRQRQREIAVHVAHGARSFDVVRLVARRELRLVLIGLAIGACLSIGEAALISTLALPFPSLDILDTIVIAIVLLVCAAIAAAVPVRAALRIAPMQILRQE